MLRSFLIYLSKATWAQKIVTHWKFAYRAASRFIAGTSLDDAIKVVKDLNAKGMNVTLDQLGEHTSTVNEASQSTDGIIAILERISKENIRSNVSIKLTQIGLALDFEQCQNNLEKILTKAKELHNFVRIDMEDTPYTDKTIELFRSMKKKGYKDIGIVVQSCLYRTELDVKKLLEESSRFRLVKGAYKEPANLAYPKKSDVDNNFDKLAGMMIESATQSGKLEVSEDGLVPPVTALGTHDEKRISFAKQFAKEKGLPIKALEFQMLFGIRRDIQESLVKEGYPVRIYVPFGTHWYPYFVRRLAERPANLWFFISNFFKK